MPPKSSSKKRLVATSTSNRTAKNTRGTRSSKHMHLSPNLCIAISNHILLPLETSRPSSGSVDDDSDGIAPVTAGSSKRKQTSQAAGQRVPKKTRAAPGSTQTNSRRLRSPVPLNKPPTQVLDVSCFGNGENGELGLGPNVTEALTPSVNPYLSPGSSSSSTFQIVQLACGGMHTIALTADNQIVTWGVNDNWALGRDTEWDGVYQDAETGSGDEEEGELNPHESTPTAISADSFPSSTRFVQVAAGDSCSFALTDHGLVYGWGTFRVSSNPTSLIQA